MGRQILLPTTVALNSSTSSTLNSDTINAISPFSNNLDFNPDALEDVVYEEKIEVDVEVQDKLDLLIDEAKAWNAKDTFIQHVVMRVKSDSKKKIDSGFSMAPCPCSYISRSFQL